MKNNDLGGYICFLRERAGYTQAELAALIGATQFYISYLESGRKLNPSIKIMAKMFDVLEMSKEEIEKFLDIHAKANGCVSYDIAYFIMANDDVRASIRSSRDKPDSYPNWDDFIKKINKE